MKWLIFLSSVLASLLGSNAIIDEKFRKDMFNIYSNIAIDTRDVAASPIFPENVTYYLFTKEQPSEYVLIDANNPQEINDQSVKYVFLIHGWTESREKPWYEDLKNAFIAREDDKYNIIQVDWSGPADQVYAISSVNTKEVGHIIGDFIVKLHNENHIPLENIQLVGHSLGGQVSGFAAKRVFNQTGTKLPRITALDPAGPLFTSRPDDEKLNKNDADVVAVIHTDGGKFGYEASIGTIDFFPNGGSDQPGCTRIDLLDIASVAEPVACDHYRSWGFYIEAVLNPTKFVAKLCKVDTKFLLLKNKVCDDDDTVTMGDLRTSKIVWCDHHRSWGFFIEAVLNPDKFTATLCKLETRLLVYTSKNCVEGNTVNMGDLNTVKTGDYYLETNNEKPYGKKTSRFDVSRLLPQF